MSEKHQPTVLKYEIRGKCGHFWYLYVLYLTLRFICELGLKILYDWECWEIKSRSVQNGWDQGL